MQPKKTERNYTLRFISNQFVVYLDSYIKSPTIKLGFYYRESLTMHVYEICIPITV